jgi:hypothetical protein
MSTNGTSDNPRLYIKPVVIPRKLQGRTLEFYVVFLVEHIKGSTLPPAMASNTADANIPFCMRLNKNWPEWILSCLENKQPGYRSCFVLSQKDKPAVVWNNLKILTPNDMSQAAGKLNLDDPSTREDMSALWNRICAAAKEYSTSPPAPVKPTAFRNAAYAAATTPTKDASKAIREARKRSIVSAYMDRKEGIEANPSTASDLRPGYRLESVDHRMLVEAFHSADTRQPPAASGAPVAAPATKSKNSNGSAELNDPVGVHLILVLGYSAPNILQNFLKYQRENEGKRGEEIAEFAEELWRTYGRATDVVANNQGGTGERNPARATDIELKGELRPSLRDPRFNDLLRSRMASNAQFAESVGQIEEAYHKFILQQGQSELRRLGRFIDSSRHRIVETEPSPGPRVQAAPGLIRFASFANSQAAQTQDGPNEYTFEQLMGQIRHYPGLMRRVALAVRCSVDLDKYVADSGVNPPNKFADLLKPAGTADSLVGFDGSASLVIWREPSEPGDPADTDGKAFLQAQTACQLGWELQGGSKDHREWYFRATPEDEAAFFGPATDLLGNRTQARKVWHTTHAVPPSLYTVTQDDVNIAAARIHHGHNDPSSNGTSATRTDSLNIYINPVSSQGPIPLAAELHKRLKKAGAISHESIARNLNWLEHLDRLSSPIRFVALGSGTSTQPPPLAAYKPDYHAEQLMQGYSVYVRRWNSTKSTWGGWRSLCRRRVDVNPLTRDLVKTAIPRGTIRGFEEEGFLSNSVATAAKPLVGLVWANTVGRAPFKPPAPFDLEVITVENKADVVCHCLPDPEVQISEIPVGGIFRRQVSFNDLKEQDFALVTPRGNKAECAQRGQYRIYVSEILIYPIFSANFDIKDTGSNRTNGSNNNPGELWEVNAINDPCDKVTPRGDERFSIVISKHATRYIDAKGVFVEKLSGTVRFTVEGDRRYYAVPWAPPMSAKSVSAQKNTDNSLKESQPRILVPVVPLDLRQLDPKQEDAVRLEAVLSNLGSADIVSYWHLKSPDACQILTLPVPFQPAGKTSDAPQSLDNIVLPPEQIETLGWLLPATSSNGTAGVPLAPNASTPLGPDSSTPPAPAVSAMPPATAKNCPGAWSAQSRKDPVSAGPPAVSPIREDLQLLRGFVERVECEAIFRVQWDVQNKAWKVFNDQCPRTYRSGKPYSLDKNKLAPFLKGLSLVPKAAVIMTVRVRGNFTDPSAPTTFDDNAVVEGPIPDSDAKYVWRVSARSFTTKQLTDVYFDDDGQQGALQYGDRFQHPLDCLKQMFELIGAPGRNGLIGRGWPQFCLGTYHKKREPNPARLCFSDGTSLSWTTPNTDPLLPDDKSRLTARFQVQQTADGTVTFTSKGKDGHLIVVGEVTSYTETPSTDQPLLRVELTDLHGKVWIIEEKVNDKSPLMIQPANSQLPPRRLSDVELGEFMVAYCDLAVTADSPVRPRVLRVQRFDGSKPVLRASLALLGRVTADKDSVASGVQLREGTDSYQIAQLSPAVRIASESNSGGVAKTIDFWCSVQSLDKLKSSPEFQQDQLVVFPALRVINAHTISQYEPPARPPGIDLDQEPQPPLHAMSSELIARWTGWSLTVKPPGRTDGTTAGEPQSGRLGIKVSPPDPTSSDARLPPLRFNSVYEFCVRRVDLAGNHHYDEPLPPCLMREAVNNVSCLYDATFLAQARSLAREGADAQILTARRPGKGGVPDDGGKAALFGNKAFTPTNSPAAPLLAYPVDRTTPAFQPKQTPLPGSQTRRLGLAPVALQGPSPARDCPSSVCPPPGKPPVPPPPPVTLLPVPTALKPFPFEVAAYPRERCLFLLTDVVTGITVTCDAEGRLLPPPSPVETVFMTGQLDGKDYRDAVKIIRDHERYYDDKCKVLGADVKGNLNYFGDLYADKFTVGLKSDDCDVAATSERLDATALCFFEHTWPRVRQIDIELTPCSRPARLRPQGPPTALSAQDVTSRGRRSCLTVPLPPGTQGWLQIYRDRIEKVWNSIPLIHATNGAWSVPEWVNLSEKHGRQDQPASTKRRLEAQLELDVPSTGGYTIHAYWNDPRDSSVDVQFAPGEGMARVGRNCCGARPSGDAGVERVDVTNPGSGLGSDAVVLIAPPRSVPDFDVIIVNRRVERVEILDAGEGCSFDLRLKITSPNGTPSPKYKSALAVAHVNRTGQVDRVTILERGEGLSEPAQYEIQWPRSPYLEAVCKGGSVESICVHDPGEGYLEDFPVRVIRRPPLVRVAEADAEVNKSGGIQRVKVTERGGWYTAPPLVVAFDLSGAGYGAVLTARLDQAGGVLEITVNDPGRNYSENVRIGIYTNQYQTTEQPLPRSLPNQRQDLCNIAFEHPLGDQRGRRVDYVVELSSRFRTFLNDKLAEDSHAECHSPAWKHVPRLSPPREIELTSYIPPVKPDVAYLMPAFEWAIRTPADLAPERAATYFVGRNSGRLVVRRIPKIRVYLHRPWHQTGIERLGVVVAPAILNTVRVPDEDSSSSNATPSLQGTGLTDGGALNPLKQIRESDYPKEPLAGYAITGELLPVVSRWGFDPVWNDQAFNPLSIDHFESRAEGVTYERIDLVEVDPGSLLTAPQSNRHVWVALHDVHYDGAKDRWYADLQLSLRDARRQQTGLPFVELALVTHQAHGMPGKRTSPVLMCDMYKLIGDRVLEVSRGGRDQFTITLSGDFDQTRDSKLWPRRDVIATISARHHDVPSEVIEYVPPSSNPSPRLGPGWANDSAKPAALLDPAVDVQEFQLRGSRRGHSYSRTIKVDPGIFSDPRQSSAQAVVLSVNEYEIFPAAEGSLDAGGEGLVVIDEQLCVRRVVYSYSCEID